MYKGLVFLVQDLKVNLVLVSQVLKRLFQLKLAL